MEEQDRSEIHQQTTTGRNSGSGRLVMGQSRLFYYGNSITLEMPGEILTILNELMDQTHHGPEELFFRSLILYKAAVDAEKAGKRMVILDSDDEIDQEITGL